MSTKRRNTRADLSPKTSASDRSLQPIILPKPALGRTQSVAKSLQQRKTIREMSGKKLSRQMLSNLLWAAYGINRKNVLIGICGRTAASASNSQEIDLYVAMPEGAYLYDAFHHRLTPVTPGDLRPLTLGRRQPDSSPEAPIRLIYVVDIDRLEHTTGFQEPGLQNPEIQKSYYYVDTGLIAGNVFLFAASVGLAAWFHNCDKPGLKSKLNLRPDQRVLFAQTIGYPAKS